MHVAVLSLPDCKAGRESARASRGEPDRGPTIAHTRVRRLDRAAITAGAVTLPFETGKAAGADVAAGPAVGVVAAGGNARLTALNFALFAAKAAGTVADPFEAGGPRRAGDAAGSAVGVVAAGIDAFAAAIDLAGLAGVAARRRADPINTETALAGAAAGAAVFRIDGEVTAEIDRAAKLDARRAVSANALAFPALDRDQPTFADAAAGAAMVEIRLQIDATCALAIGEATRACWRRGRVLGGPGPAGTHTSHREHRERSQHLPARRG